MPVHIRKLPGTNKYRVSDSKHIHANRTSLSKAKKQERLLRAIKHGFKPMKVR